MSERHAMLFEMRAAMDDLTRPWVAFIGGVELRPSPYASVGDVFAVNAASAGFPDLGQQVVIHPDSLPAARRAVEQWCGRTVGDLELAAALYWYAHKMRRQTP